MVSHGDFCFGRDEAFRRRVLPAPPGLPLRVRSPALVTGLALEAGSLPAGGRLPVHAGPRGRSVLAGLAGVGRCSAARRTPLFPALDVGKTELPASAGGGCWEGSGSVFVEDPYSGRRRLLTSFT